MLHDTLIRHLDLIYPNADTAALAHDIEAAFGLVMTILGGIKYRAEAVPMLVGLYITAGYWFTASTSFANPAVTLARGFTDSFSGIRPVDMPLFWAAQITGAVLALLVMRALLAQKLTAE